MTRPYEPGQSAVWLEAVPEGMRVSRATVLAVEPDDHGWTVETTEGRESVDYRGEGSRLVPMDAELSSDFDISGESFIVRSTVQVIEADLDRSLDWRRFERTLDPELDRDEPDYDR